MARFTPAIDMQVDCSYGDHVVARTKDPKRNQLTVTLQNLGTIDLLWKAGKDAAAGFIVVDFSTLLSSQENQNAVVTSSGWTATLSKETKPFTWILRPDADFILPKKRLFRLIIALPAAGDQVKAGPHDFSVTCTGVHDAADEQRKADKTLDTFLVLVPSADKPGKSLATVVACSIEPPGKVFCWDRNAYVIDNTVRLAIVNTQMDAPLVPATTPRSKTAVFQIVFPVIKRPAAGDDPTESPSRKALTYLDHAKQIGLTGVTSENPAHPWTGRVNPEELIWEVRAEPSGGPNEPQNLEILGKGGAVMVDIGPIRTELPPFPTQVYILYTDVPGYDDGYITTQLWKEPPTPTILKFDANPPQVEYGQDSTLEWKTIGADVLEISYEDDNRQTVTLSSANKDGATALAYPSGKLVLPHPRRTTTYTLKLLGGQGVTSPPQDDVTVSVKKAWASLVVVPTEVRKGGTVKLDWTVTGPWKFDGLMTDDRSTFGHPGRALTKAKDVLMTKETPQSLIVNPLQTTTYTLKGVSNTPMDLALQADAVIKVCPQLVKEFSCDPDPKKVTLNLKRLSSADNSDAWSVVETATLSWDTVFSSSTTLVATPDRWDASGATDTIAWTDKMKLTLEHPDESGVPRRKQVTGLPDGGHMVVAPSRTTTIALVCDGLEPPPPATVVVNVNAVVIKSFVGTRIQGPSGDLKLAVDWGGDSVDFKIRVAHATAVRIERTKILPAIAWSNNEPIPASGDAEFTVRLQVFNDCIFTAVAEGPGGPVRWPISVTIAKGPKVQWFKMTKGGDKANLDVTFNWGTVGATMWRIGTRSKTASPLPTSGYDSHEHPIQLDEHHDYGDNSENPREPTNSVTSGSLSWPKQDPDGYGGVSDEFLNDNVFYLVAWERNGSVPVVQVVEIVKQF